MVGVTPFTNFYISYYRLVQQLAKFELVMYPIEYIQGSATVHTHLRTPILHPNFQSFRWQSPGAGGRGARAQPSSSAGEGLARCCSSGRRSGAATPDPRPLASPGIVAVRRRFRVGLPRRGCCFTMSLPLHLLQLTPPHHA